MCERCRERPKVAGRGQRLCEVCKDTPPTCSCGLTKQYRVRTRDSGTTYRMWYCAPCDAAKKLAAYHADPDTYNRRRRAAMYGITVEEYDALLMDGVCNICGRVPEGERHESVLHIDHDHSTGRVRGALCGNCNKALGLVGDNVAVLQAMIEYLTEEDK